jgi:hypothetical protein
MTANMPTNLETYRSQNRANSAGRRGIPAGVILTRGCLKLLAQLAIRSATMRG